MSARFRIRTPQGQELSFGSEEMFADFVRSGDLSEGDLVYDATTGEWSPAFTHSLVLGLQAGDEADRTESSPEGSSEPAETPPAEGAGESGPTEGLTLELAPEQTPEEASAAFVKEMQAERAMQLDRYEEVRGFEKDESSSGLLREIERDPPPPPREPVARSGSERDEPPRRGPKRTPPTRNSGTRRHVSSAFLLWALGLAGVGAAALIVPDLVALAMGGDEAGEVEAGPLAGALPDTEEAVEARADVRFLGRVRTEILRLPPIPDDWLHGRYLANASAYPEVGEVWVAYLNEALRLRAEESEEYSAAYLSALDDARVTGATRTLRLASALSRFERRGAERAAHYDRVEGLAQAALALHDLLLDREEDITFEPAVGPRISADPVLQAAGRDPETQRQLEAALDRVLDALSPRNSGPVEAAALPAWVFDGLRDAVAPE
jgi:hypothetical protein